MKNFKEYLSESSQVKALKHLYHPEELIFLEGASGVTTAIEFIRQAKETLHKKNSSVRISRKWDGAPSTVFGHIDGKFFVGSKSVFNATPKINYTEEDIKQNHSESPGLAAKLRIALQYLSKVTPKNGLIYQGDFLFDDEIKTTKKVDGAPHHVFRPNTISYAVQTSTPTGKLIGSAKMGIVVHTYYDSLDSSAKFLPDLKGFKKSKDVFVVDAEVEMGDKILLSDTEYNKLSTNLADVEKINKKLSTTNFYSVVGGKLSETITTFNNKLIRENKKLDPSGVYTELLAYAKERGEKEVSKVKSDAAKQKKMAEMQLVINALNDNKENFKLAFKMYNDLVDIKSVLVDKFNQLKMFGTFIDDGKTFVPTNDEGFVMVGDGGVLKLVDRFEFSRINFTLVKTW